MTNESPYSKSHVGMFSVKIAEILLILKNSIKGNLFLFYFSILYYGIIIFLAGYLNIWEDELYSLNTSSKTIAYAFHQSEFFELQPPFYFLLLTIWRSISDSILWARMLNVVFIFLSQILIYKFVLKVADKKRAIFTTALFLLNPTIIYLLLEIRLPALLILLSLITSMLFYDTYYCYNISPAKRIFFIFIAVAGLFTQHYFGFLLFANALGLFITGKKRGFWLYIIDMIIPLCLVLLYIPQVLRSADMHFAASPIYNRTGSDLFSEARILISQISFGYFLPSGFIVSPIWNWTIRGIFIVLLIWIGFNTRKSIDVQKFLLFIGITFIIYLFFLIVDIKFGKYAVLLPKYTIIAFIPVLISMVIFLRLSDLRLLKILAFFLAFMYLTQNFTTYHKLYKHHDFKSLSNFLKQDEEKGQDIFVYRNINSEVLKTYYKGVNNIYPIMKPFSFNSEYTTKDWVITKQNILEFNERLKSYKDFYIIVFENELAEFEEFHKNLVDFLKGNYKIEKEKYFNQFIFLYKVSARKQLGIE